MPYLAMIRHGESDWNLQNRFTGWVDVDLSETGVAQARRAGELLRAEGIEFDLAFTSVLKRAIRTLWIVLDEHGPDVAAADHELAAERAPLWRPAGPRTRPRPPPSTATSRSRSGGAASTCRRRRWRSTTRCTRATTRATRACRRELLPATESLKITLDRVMPYWGEAIAPRLQRRPERAVAAHGNSLRALAKHLFEIGDQDIIGLEIPTGNPILVELDDDAAAGQRALSRRGTRWPAAGAPADRPTPASEVAPAAAGERQRADHLRPGP